jgi:hypothetical protein
MPDERSLVPTTQPGQLVTQEVSYNFSLNKTVTDISERAAASALAVERARNVEPLQVVMRYAFGFLALVLIGALIVKGQWSDRLLETALVVAGVIASGAVIAKLLKKNDKDKKD